MGLLPDYSADKQTGSVMGVRCQENRPVPFMGRPVAIKAFRLVMPSFGIRQSPNAEHRTH